MATKANETKKNTKTKNSTQRTILLRGEGANLHVLEGEYVEVDQNNEDEVRLFEVEEAYIKHETPSGEKAEHETLKIENGMYVFGKQVEYNPTRRIVTRIWD